jgi:hypothetical protein
MDHPFDPALPLDVELSFESPHVVLYRLWTRLPDQETWTVVASGTDDALSNPSAHRHRLPPLPSGSRVAVLMNLSGNPETAFRARLELLQEGRAVMGGSHTFRGLTDRDGFAMRRREVEL